MRLLGQDEEVETTSGRDPDALREQAARARADEETLRADIARVGEELAAAVAARESAEQAHAAEQQRVAALAQRAADRIGDQVRVLVEEVDEDEVVGRTAEQGPEIDGVTLLELPAGAPPPSRGDLVDARVVGSEGVDLVAVPR